MSALPKNKMCWNCDGTVPQGSDNCTYCGVYVQSENWNPAYNPTAEKSEDVPSPLYQIHPQVKVEEADLQVDIEEEKRDISQNHFLNDLEKDLFPVLFLMMGSTFLLFGLVIFLFSQGGVFTLHWTQSQALYFILPALPLLILGWKYMQSLED